MIDRSLGPGEPVGHGFEHARPRRRHPLGLMPGAAEGQHWPFGLEGLGRAQHGAQHEARRGERIARHPLDRLQELLAERGTIEGVIDVLEPVMREIVGRRAPDDAKRGPADQRHDDDRSGN